MPARGAVKAPTGLLCARAVGSGFFRDQIEFPLSRRYKTRIGLFGGPGAIMNAEIETTTTFDETEHERGVYRSWENRVKSFVSSWRKTIIS